MHMYNFDEDNTWYLTSHIFTYMGSVQLKDKPILIGEFCLGMNNLELVINTFEDKSFSWTSWAYKTNDRGGWGMRNLKMDRVNISHATFDEIAECFRNSNSENATISNEFNTLLDILK